jgi:hypothetical protein
VQNIVWPEFLMIYHRNIFFTFYVGEHGATAFFAEGMVSFSFFDFAVEVGYLLVR